MPRYKVTSPEGRSLTLSGDSPPTEQELEQIFSSVPASTPKQENNPVTDFAVGGVPALGFGGSAKPADIPYIAAKTGSGALMGVPEMAATNPISGPSGMAMRTGANLVGDKIPPEPNLFPQPQTQTGKVLGIGSELGMGAVNPLGQGAADATSEAIEPVTKKASGGIINYLIKPSPNELKNGKNLGQEMLEGGLVKPFQSLGGMEDTASNSVNNAEENLQNILKNKAEKLDLMKIASDPSLNSSTQGYIEAGKPEAVEAVNKVKNGLLESATRLDPENGMVNLSDANDVKRNLYGNINWSPNAADTAANDAREIAANRIKTGIEETANDPNVKLLNKTEGLGLRAKKAIGGAIASAEKRPIISGLDVVSAFHPSTLKADIARRILGIPQVDTALASGIYNLPNSSMVKGIPQMVASGGQGISNYLLKKGSKG